MKRKPNFIFQIISDIRHLIKVRRDLVREKNYLKVENEILKSKVAELRSADKS